MSWFEQRHAEPWPRLRCECREGAALVSIEASGNSRLAVRADLSVCAGEPVAPWSAPDTHEDLDRAGFYAELSRTGLELEAGHGAVAKAELGPAGLRAELRADNRDTDAGYLVGPNVLDAALHCALVFARRRLGRGVSIWPSIEQLTVEAAAEPVVRIELLERERRADAAERLDIVLLDAAGRPAARLDGVLVATARVADEQMRTELEAVFEAIVRTCVPVPELGTESKLTALGLTSIDLVRIGSQIEECLGWAPPFAELVADPSIAGLARLYRRAAPPPPVEVSGPAPDTGALSATERQLWFLERLTNVAGSYNEAFAWRIRGPLVVDALERALQLVQRRHPALQSYFPARDGVPERRLDWRQLSLELVVTPDAARRSPELLQRAIEDVVRRPFDLEHAPPIRCVLLMQAAGEATLVVAVHHIVCDAWSFARVFVPELSAAYAAIRADSGVTPGDRETCASELTRREPDAEYLRAAESHFRARLGSMPHVLDFPFDHPRPPQQTHRGAVARRRLGAERWRAIKALARGFEVSPFVVCLAAYEQLLSRYTRQSEFCLGIPLSLRRSRADEGAFGCFVNVSVLPAHVDPTWTLREHCHQVRAALVETLRFDQLALGDVVRAVAPSRSLSHTPLVQAVFGYREFAGADLVLDGTEVAPCSAHNRCAKFDLALAIDDYGPDAEVNLEYATDIVESARADRLLAHFEALLDEAVRVPAAAVGSLRLGGEAEREQIAASEAGVVRPAPLRELGLSPLAQRGAGDPVVRTGSRLYSAGELAEAARRVCSALRAAGVQPGDFVALCAPRSFEWVAAALGVLEAGAAYAPFDPAQPGSRIQHGVARCGARVVLSLDGAFAAERDDLRVFELRALLTGAAESGPATGGALAAGAARAGAPVYGIMTSGSTGLPRVAAVARAGFSNLLDWYLDVLQLGPADKVLFATSVGFDLTQKNVFAAFAARAELVIDEGPRLDPERLIDLIEQHAVTVVNCTPSLAYALVASAAVRDLRRLRSVRVLVLGGEPIDVSVLRPWLDHPSCRLRILNSYGPTECSDVVTAVELGPGGGADIGLPIPNARCRVVDPNGATAAIGVPGELWISGTPLGLGYLGDPGATAAKFVEVDGVTWYRTGDLVRRGEAGQLLYMGRIDTQVKIRGYRIELTEIEAALKQQPEVRDAIVLAQPDARGRPMLVGYVVPVESGDARTDEGMNRAARELAVRLRAHLALELPSYMIPNVLLSIDRVPRTPSGKLDRNALPAPQLAAVPAGDSEHELLARVVEVCGRVLGSTAVDADADFFELGGHSLAAVELVSRLEAELGVPLRVATLFERPALRDYAAYLAERLATETQGAGGRTASERARRAV